MLNDCAITYKRMQFAGNISDQHDIKISTSVYIDQSLILFIIKSAL